MSEPEMPTIDPAVDSLLTACTAEMLALPQRWCLHNRCRRDRRCHGFLPAGAGMPDCLADLPAEHRAVCDRLRAAAIVAFDQLSCNRPMPLPADPEALERHHAAVEIAEFVLSFNPANRRILRRRNRG